MQMAERKTLSIQEVAKWLGVNPRTVYRLVQRGKLPGFRVGNRWRFHPALLEEWMAHRVTVEQLKATQRKET